MTLCWALFGYATDTHAVPIIWQEGNACPDQGIVDGCNNSIPRLGSPL
jgi:hypothetical protein